MTGPEIVAAARDIAGEYNAQGLTLTLRQLYYQFVSRGLLPNHARTYKRLGAILTAARYAGDFPIKWIEDRGRHVHAGDYTATSTLVEFALKHAAHDIRNIQYNIHRARWYGQPVHVSVWVEKEALAGIFESVCRRLGVSWFACKGYPSVSSLNEWVHQTMKAMESGAERAVVLYFGDHDPEGFGIPKSSESKLRQLQELYKVKWAADHVDALGGDSSDLDEVKAWAGEAPPPFPIEFVRCALTMDQIKEHNPPPFPAKATSSRFQAYIEDQGTTDAWELDALDPSILRGLITDHVRGYFNESIHEGNDELVEARREELADRMLEGDWLQRALRGEE